MATADPGSVTRTGNAYVDSLLWGDAWDQSTGPITYDFWRVDESFAWTGSEKIAFRAAMASWSAVAAVSFSERSDEVTDLNFLLLDLEPHDGVTPYATQYGPNGDDFDGIGRYDRDTFDDWFGQLRPGGFAYSVIVHELGHALGLAHPHDHADGWSPIFPGVTTNEPYDTGNYGLNTGLYTVMSYNDYGQWWAPDGEAAYGFVAGPMAFDIAAIQHIYGANMTTRTGSDTYALPGANRTGTAYSCIWDAGGTDRITYSGSLDVVIDLRDAPLTGRHAGGYLSRAEGVLGGFTIANGVVVERAYAGRGDDSLTGNDAANLLSGGGGADVMAGGAGDDTYRVDDAGDQVVERARRGLDRVYASVDHALADHVETLLLTGSARLGTGNDAANALAGNRHANTLDGAGGADVLDGAEGDDVMRGGAGDDTLLGAAGRDRFDGGTGTDLASYADATSGVVADLAGAGSRGDAKGDRYASIEAVLGSAYADTLRGGDGRELIDGADGDDRLEGGADDDRLYGGNGTDRLYGGDGADRVYGGDGRDLLSGGDDADRLYAGLGTGSLYGGDGDDLLYGSDLADRLAGDGGDDRADGGDGDDAVYGGDGDDSLFGSTGDDRLDGGDGDDFLHAGDGNDRLIGGAGNDSLYGGRGDDRFYIGDGDDTVAGASGIDTVMLDGPSADYTVDRTDPARLLLHHGSDVAVLVGIEYLRFADALAGNGPSLDTLI